MSMPSFLHQEIVERLAFLIPRLPQVSHSAFALVLLGVLFLCLGISEAENLLCREGRKNSDAPGTFSSPWIKMARDKARSSFTRLLLCFADDRWIYISSLTVSW